MNRLAHLNGAEFLERVRQREREKKIQKQPDVAGPPVEGPPKIRCPHCQRVISPDHGNTNAKRKPGWKPDRNDYHKTMLERDAIVLAYLDVHPYVYSDDLVRLIGDRTLTDIRKQVSKHMSRMEVAGQIRRVKNGVFSRAVDADAPVKGKPTPRTSKNKIFNTDG